MMLTLLQGCSSVPLPDARGIFRMSEGSSDVRQALLKEYDSWKGVPYKYGGESRAGIDCSAFVQRTFADQFRISLPRTTARQIHVGSPVKRSELEIGDLVFFRMGHTGRHVGMYLGRDEFLHAGTTEGVTISSLNNLYWHKFYITARRVLQPENK